MKKVVHKWFWVWDFDKEEKWLNEMAEQGWALCAVGFGRYEFEKSKPGEYKIGMGIMKNSHTHEETKKYLKFLIETGAQVIGRWNRWIYFRKKVKAGSFEIYTDNISKIQQITRILVLVVILGAANLYIGLQYLYEVFAAGGTGNGMSLISLAIGILCMVGICGLYQKRKRLKAEKLPFDSTGE